MAILGGAAPKPDYEQRRQLQRNQLVARHIKSLLDCEAAYAGAKPPAGSMLRAYRCYQQGQDVQPGASPEDTGAAGAWFDAAFADSPELLAARAIMHARLSHPRRVHD